MQVKSGVQSLAIPTSTRWMVESRSTLSRDVRETFADSDRGTEAERIQADRRRQSQNPYRCLGHRLRERCEAFLPPRFDLYENGTYSVFHYSGQKSKARQQHAAAGGLESAASVSCPPGGRLEEPNLGSLGQIWGFWFHIGPKL